MPTDNGQCVGFPIVGRNGVITVGLHFVGKLANRMPRLVNYVDLSERLQLVGHLVRVDHKRKHWMSMSKSDEW